MSRVRLDLNSPDFLATFLALRGKDLEQVAKSLSRLRTLEWEAVYRSKGLNWEAIDHIPAPKDQGKVYSVQLSQKIRALVYREADFMRFISLHPDHDSAYRKR